MSLWDAEEQAKALTQLAVPIFFFGLLLFIEALIAPYSEPARSVAAWLKLIPIAMAFYIYLAVELPSAFGRYIDDYAEKTVMLAGARAGSIAILFMLATLLLGEVDTLWVYENAVDMVFGVYLMAGGSRIWWEMREDPEPELEQESVQESKAEEHS
ncbi:MAG: hypothetical protein MJK04_16535 [Psychrosphaera sp.]|nr:hypothetical protein [Psychrosphaera sp.]